MKLKSLLPILLLLSGFTAYAQGDIEDLVKGSAADANYLVQGYAEPLLKGLGYGLNQGWYNTAAPHKIAGFDLTFPVSASLMLVPNKDMQFQIDNSRLTSIERLNGPNGAAASGPAQTILGTDQETTLRLKASGNQFSMPGGLNLKQEIGINAVPFAMVQLGFGLPKQTDIKLRYVPDLKSFGDDVSVNLFGIGVMHEIKQWIPGIKNLPFSLSGFVGYTKLKIGVGFDSGSSSTGSATYEVNATTIQGLISKKLSVLTLYGGLGVNIAKSDLTMTGKFDTDDDSTTADQSLTILANASSSGPRATAGFRLKLAIFTIHADYTLQKYNAINAGLGLSIR